MLYIYRTRLTLSHTHALAARLWIYVILELVGIKLWRMERMENMMTKSSRFISYFIHVAPTHQWKRRLTVTRAHFVVSVTDTNYFNVKYLHGRLFTMFRYTFCRLCPSTVDSFSFTEKKKSILLHWTWPLGHVCECSNVLDKWIMIFHVRRDERNMYIMIDKCNYSSVRLPFEPE